MQSSHLHLLHRPRNDPCSHLSHQLYCSPTNGVTTVRLATRIRQLARPLHTPLQPTKRIVIQAVKELRYRL